MPNARTQGSSGSEGLADALQKVEQQVGDAERLSRAQADGEAVDLHRVVIAQQSAHLAVQSAVTIRNTAIAAYREILRSTEG